MITTSGVIQSLLSTIEPFADLDWQYKEWVCWTTNPYASSTESMCMLFDNAKFDDILDRYADQFNFSKQQYESLQVFRETLNGYYDNCLYEDADMIQDPEWHNVVQKAQAVLEAFKTYDFSVNKEFFFSL